MKRFSGSVPEALVASHAKHFDGTWIAGLPDLAEDLLTRWDLRVDGPPRHGVVALVLPVLRPDGAPAVLKLQPVDDESRDEPLALRTWAGRGAVRLLDHDPASGTMLLERLDVTRHLADVPDDRAAVAVIANLLAELTAVPAPDGLRRLGDIAQKMLADVPKAVERVSEDEGRFLLFCAAAVREVVAEPGDRLLHWDLHYDNVMASAREPWLAIDPKPLAGDPGFDLMPALDNRWADIEATGDVARAVRWRFDLLTEVLALDRRRAAAWTLGRALQNSLWDVEDGETALQPEQRAIVDALRAYR